MTPVLIQQALYVALSEALSVPVYDYVPQGTAFPYVSIGEDVVSTWNSDTEQGFDIVLNIHVWSRYAGFKEAKGIQQEIFETLQYSDGFEYVQTNLGPRFVLDFIAQEYQSYIAGASLPCVVSCVFENADIVRDPDGLTSHGAQRFRFIVDNAS